MVALSSEGCLLGFEEFINNFISNSTHGRYSIALVQRNTHWQLRTVNRIAFELGSNEAHNNPFDVRVPSGELKLEVSEQNDEYSLYAIIRAVLSIG